MKIKYFEGAEGITGQIAVTNDNKNFWINTQDDMLRYPNNPYVGESYLLSFKRYLL